MDELAVADVILDLSGGNLRVGDACDLLCPSPQLFAASRSDVSQCFHQGGRLPRTCAGHQNESSARLRVQQSA